jgi:DNA-binding XRE family transcriptional regulator
MSQAQLAEAIGLRRTSVANIEAGRQQCLTHHLVAIANALDLTFAELVPEGVGPRPLRTIADAPPRAQALVDQLSQSA